MKWIDTIEIREWAKRKECQELLPQLVRKLIRATCYPIEEILFPSGENIQIGGWDGILKISKKNEYLPKGTSLWEFGVSAKVKDKADKDYQKRTSIPLGFDPSESTFIFVTPRLWKAGTKWAQKKKEEGIWKDVKVFNAELLEEWIETAPVVGAWLAKQIGKFPEEGIQPTDHFWQEWSTGTKFNLVPDIILGGREKEQKLVNDFYKQPKVISVQGVSKEEALAFIIACFKVKSELEEDFFTRSIIVDNVEIFRKLARYTKPLILIARFEDDSVVNLAIKNKHTVFLPLSADSSGTVENRVILPAIERNSFVAGLENMGFSKELAERYSKESARNISVLRRQLGFVRTLPSWASKENVFDIIPALLVGRWDESSNGDKGMISLIANENYSDYIRRLSKWLNTPDAPILRIGNKWRLTSSFDAWANASKYLIRADFERLHTVFLEVLSEENQAFKLEPEKRPMASLYGKKREFSSWIREGVIQSLILTSVFGSKLNFDLPYKSERWVDEVVWQLLKHKNPLLWKSLNRELPLLAEAAPSSFLEIVEEHLSRDNSPILKLFEEEPGLFFPQSHHIGLLSALECLAWFPEYLSRVSLILARLAVLDPGGIISNRPINSLSEIFKPWHYQTLASFEERFQVLGLIARREPEIAWEILIPMLPDMYGETAISIHKPRWRLLEEETEKPVTRQELLATHSAVVDLLLSSFDFEESQLAELFKKVKSLSPSDREKVLTFLEGEIRNTNHAKHLCWHAIRQILHEHNSYPESKFSLPKEVLIRYEKLFNELIPKDVVSQNIWLFNESWPSLPEGLKHEKGTHEKHEKLILDRRKQALSKIYTQCGLKKIISLIDTVEQPNIFGDILGYLIEDENEIIELCKALSENGRRLRVIQSFVSRKAWNNGFSWIAKLFQNLKKQSFSNQALAQLLISVNQTKELWDFVEGTHEEIKTYYWMNIRPRFYWLSPEEKIYGIKKLLEYERYLGAIHARPHNLEEIPSELIVEMLYKAGTQKTSEQIKIDLYEVGELFKKLDDRNDIDNDTFIQLEWVYLSILNSHNSARKPKRLFEELAKSPDFFINVLSWAYKPNNDELLRQEETKYSNDQFQQRGLQAWRLLSSWKKIPGMDDEGNIEASTLNFWVENVRKLAAKCYRLELADSHIGKVLAQYPEGEDVWPPEAICGVIESVNTQKIRQGFSTATFNKRGFTSRGPFEGGDIERSKADYFQKLFDVHKNKYPSIARIFERLALNYRDDAQKRDDEAENDLLDY